MILRKPYAFLIKYFKLINIVLAILSSYIVYKLYNITQVFNEYINNNYSGNYYQGFYSEYISPLLYLVIILIFIGLFFIIILFINKKKPVKMYVSTIVYNIIIIFFLNLVKNTMITMVNTIITAETARVFRDLSVIAIFPESDWKFTFVIDWVAVKVCTVFFKLVWSMYLFNSIITPP